MLQNAHLTTSHLESSICSLLWGIKASRIQRILASKRWMLIESEPAHVLNLDETNTWNKSYKRNLWWNYTRQRKTVQFCRKETAWSRQSRVCALQKFSASGRLTQLSQSKTWGVDERWGCRRKHIYIYIAKTNAPKIYRELEDELFLLFFWEPQASGRSISGRKRATTLP